MQRLFGNFDLIFKLFKLLPLLLLEFDLTRLHQSGLEETFNFIVFSGTTLNFCHLSLLCTLNVALS